MPIKSVFLKGTHLGQGEKLNHFPNFYFKNVCIEVKNNNDSWIEYCSIRNLCVWGFLYIQVFRKRVIQNEYFLFGNETNLKCDQWWCFSLQRSRRIIWAGKMPENAIMYLIFIMVILQDNNMLRIVIKNRTNSIWIFWKVVENWWKVSNVTMFNLINNYRRNFRIMKLCSIWWTLQVFTMFY